jgi:hypothetical protein
MKHTSRLLLALSLLLVFGMTFAPAHAAALVPATGAQAESRVQAARLPSLDEFTRQVNNGLASQVTGLYIKGVLAYPVIQQPSGQPAYVSNTAATITQFGMATSYGSLGFLAHNTLAGAKFSEITLNALISVVYGDGHTVVYQVSQMRSFQATQPTSPYSSFIDLSSNKTLSATELFTQTYGTKGTLILQTCIASGTVDSWGRLFVIATPYVPEPANNQ